MPMKLCPCLKKLAKQRKKYKLTRQTAGQDDADRTAVSRQQSRGGDERGGAEGVVVGAVFAGGQDIPLPTADALPEDAARGAQKKQTQDADGFASRHSGVSKSQMKEFREAFRLFDKDGDGSITKEELGRFMRSLGQFARTEELQQMLQEVDVDGDGNVSFDEFVDIAWSAGAGSDPDHVLSREEEEKELRDAFRVFDKHNRGYITASDLRAVLQCLGEDLSEEEIEDMIREVDQDGDGRIDFYEFVNALGEPGTEDSIDDDEDDVSIF